MNLELSADGERKLLALAARMCRPVEDLLIDAVHYLETMLETQDDAIDGRFDGERES